MRYDLAIFDLDGTLADSFPFFVAVHNRLAAKHGFRLLAPDEIEALRHRSPREVMRHVGLPRWRLPWVARDFIRLMHDCGQAMPLFDGIADALHWLDSRGVALAVVTSNSCANLRRVLGPALLARMLHVECGASMFGKRRRLQRVLARSGVSARRAIYIGDQLTDADAARAAGIAFGAVAWGYGTIGSLMAAGPERVFTTVPELRRIHCAHGARGPGESMVGTLQMQRESLDAG